jgi:uncharacterized protein YcaQ
MERARKLEGYQPARAAHLRSERAHQKKVLKEIERRGPLAAADLEDPGERSGPWWGWHRGKDTLEYLFRAGLVTTAFRRGAFERVYDLTERVIPAEILNLPTPPLADAMRAQAEAGARAFGIATEFDIRDYFRLPVADARRAIAELVESGRLRPVTVEGWDKTAYLHADAAQPATVAPTALLSPFDPLVWFRPRTERIFDFHYRIEIYTPEPKRKFGYYVLPFLHQGRIVGRVDLKSDRAAGVLVAKAAHAEKRGGPAAVPALAAELRRMATWLDLGDVRAEARGDLGPLLVKEMAAG